MVVLNADFELSSFVIVVVVETVQMRDTITFLFISGFAGIEHFLIFFEKLRFSKNKFQIFESER